MPSDTTDYQETPEIKETAAELQPKEPLSERGQRAMQGRDVSSAEKGADFENWAKQEVFHGQGRRLNVPRQYNEHLIDVDDAQIGLQKTTRYSDAYLDEDGIIQELKAGYEKGGIDHEQARDYALMQDAGHVWAKTDAGDLKRTDIHGVNYIFDSKSGAEANRGQLEQYGFGVLFRDENGELRQLKDE